MTAHTARPGGRLVANARLVVAVLIGLAWGAAFLWLVGVTEASVVIAAIGGALIGATVETVLA